VEIVNGERRGVGGTWDAGARCGSGRRRVGPSALRPGDGLATAPRWRRRRRAPAAAGRSGRVGGSAGEDGEGAAQPYLTCVTPDVALPPRLEVTVTLLSADTPVNVTV